MLYRRLTAPAPAVVMPAPTLRHFVDERPYTLYHYREVEKIVKKGFPNKQEYVYKLIALKDGWYNVYTHGFPGPTNQEHLDRGDIWKYGETTSNERYDKKTKKRKVLR